MDHIAKAIDLCEAGFAEYTAGYYGAIDRLLSDVEQTDAVIKARKLAKAGPTLVSPRFAYPHIKSALLAD